MKYGTVFVFVIVVSAIFTWANFGDLPLETRIGKLYILLPGILSAVFAYLWYRLRELTDRVEKLERLSEVPQEQ